MDMSSAVSNSLNTELIWQEDSMLVSKLDEDNFLAAGALLMTTDVVKIWKVVAVEVNM